MTPMSTMAYQNHWEGLRSHHLRELGGAARGPAWVAHICGQLSWWLAAMTIVGCREQRRPTEFRVASAWLTGNAAAAVTPDGQFQIRVTQRHPQSEITAVRAVQIATTWTHTSGQWLRGAFERDRGAAVDPRHVTQCGRVFYADTPYADLPPTASHAMRTVFGPWWLVTLCDAAQRPAISVAVSGYSTNLVIANGIVIGIGGELFATGIPIALSTVPMSPEEAAQIAVNETGARVSEVPTLVMGPREAPQTAKWLVTLDRPISIRGVRTGIVRATTSLLVGFERSWQSKAIQDNDPAAPATISVVDAAAVTRGDTVPRFQIAARRGFATAIERVQVTKP